MKTTFLRVGAVQIDSQASRVQENLRHAADLLEAAVQQEAQLVLLPELMPSGYLLKRSCGTQPSRSMGPRSRGSPPRPGVMGSTWGPAAWKPTGKIFTAKF